MKRKTLELVLMFAWNIPAIPVAMMFGNNYLVTTFIFLCVPSVYISFRKPVLIKKVTLFSLAMCVPVGIADYLAHIDGSWFVPSFFPRIFGVYPFEDYVWTFLFTYATIMFYEYFFEHERKFKFPHRFKATVFVVILTSVVFGFSVYASPQYFVVPYFYAILVAIFFIAIPWTILYLHQILIPKVLKTGIFFLVPWLLLEYFANIKQNWSFPGTHFIGYVQAAGITIPLEELLWILLAVPAFIALYELLADDER